MHIQDLENKTIQELVSIAKELNVEGYSRLRKKELVFEILKANVEKDGFIFASGVLDIMQDGYGFLRPINYLPSNEDIYVSPSQIRRFSMHTGDYVAGKVRPPKDKEKYYALLYVEAINGEDPERAAQRIDFGNLTPIHPNKKFTLERENKEVATRLIDLISPIGKGQRGLIVSPPKAGKTTILKNLAQSIEENHPDVHLIVLLIDERPEEVTEMERSVSSRSEVLASTFDERPENHVRLAEMISERAKRLVEHGRDVVILLDSITRLARASNLVVSPSGRTLSGGLDPAALYNPKSFYGAARNMEDGGSLTIIATALVNTGSRMDDVIYEEFKGTGNMELHLDRKLAQRHVYPAIDILRSGTRREELLIDEDKLEIIWKLRNSINPDTNINQTREIIKNLKLSQNNEEFLQIIEQVFNQ
ncbi:MAG: transcription termination factor Rho [Clostridia bacterium]